MSEAVPLPAGPVDIRPRVARAVNNRGAWIFAGILGASSLGLFATLEARRSNLSSPAITAPTFTSGGVIAAPPDLSIPQDGSDYAYADQMPPQFVTSPRQQALGQQAFLQPPQVRPVPVTRTPPRTAADAATLRQAHLPPSLPGTGGMAQPGAMPQGPGLSQAGALPSPAFAYQASQHRTGQSDTAGAATHSDDRALAAKLANPATTVPQGTVIQAVMETAFDSTRSGFARAVVSRDVVSFDGSQVLIPKGSKLFGDYKADVGLGQNRAVIQWHRLTRPDGSIIDVDSPAADPLGRMGVKGKVNSHFLARFGGAILQTALDVGFQLATQRVTGNTVIVGLPGSLQNATTGGIAKVEDVKPTVSLKQGAGVTVFVGRDLDFTPVEP